MIRFYDDHPFLATTGLRVEPIELRHDGGPTFGFRIEASAERREPPVSVGYVADTGCWSEKMAESLIDVDLLGIEFSHDVDLQRTSRRPEFLVRRNLGDDGHLSNTQGAELLGAILKRSRSGAVRHVVLLHLSEQFTATSLTSPSGRPRKLSAPPGVDPRCTRPGKASLFRASGSLPSAARARAGLRAPETPVSGRSAVQPAPDSSRDVAGHFGWDSDQDPTAVGTI